MSSIFDYTLRSLVRNGYKNVLIAAIFALLVWFISSVIFITNSLKFELQSVVKETPQLVVNKQIAGRYYFLNEKDLDPFWQIPGVSYVKGRVWGQYYLPLQNSYITLIGITPYEEHYNEEITKVAELLPVTQDTNNSLIYLSKSVYELLKPYRSHDDIVAFEKIGGGYEKLKVGGFFKSQTELFSNDVVLMPNENVRNILGIGEGEFVDAIIKVPNPTEVAFIAAKLMHLHPKLKIATKEEILKDYELLYQFKSGWFLMIFSVALVLFAIILYDKATGLRSEERREIGILKALGWEINHIIYHKLFESVILSIGAFLLGVIVALFYVYILEAPGLKYIFMGYSSLKQPFSLVFVLDLKTIAMLFFATVPFYVGVSIIPSWKAATDDAGEVMR